MFFLFGLWVLKRFVPLVRRSQYLDARGQRLKIEFRMTRLQVPVAPVLHGTVIDIFPYLWFPCTYTYILAITPSLSYCCRIYLYPTIHELDPISIKLAIVDGYVFL
jgi:hypothetical protein